MNFFLDFVIIYISFQWIQNSQKNSKMSWINLEKFFPINRIKKFLSSKFKIWSFKLQIKLKSYSKINSYGKNLLFKLFWMKIRYFLKSKFTIYSKIKVLINKRIVSYFQSIKTILARNSNQCYRNYLKKIRFKILSIF